MRLSPAFSAFPRFAVLMCPFASLGITATRALGATPQTIYNLGLADPNAELNSSTGDSINNTGQVAGVSAVEHEKHPFLYSGTPGSGGVMRDLTRIGDSSGEGYGINSAGVVAGFHFINSPSTLYQAFQYTGVPGAGGALVNLDTFNGASSSYARGINASGQITGYVGSHGFLYTPGSGIADLGTLSANGFSRSFAINDSGSMTGWAGSAFLYTGTPGADGHMMNLGTLGGFSMGFAINNRGQVAGQSTMPGGASTHAFRYVGTPGAGGTMIDLPTLGGTNSAAKGINEDGVLVGYSDRAAGAGGASVAAMWLANNDLVDLDAWLDATDPVLGAYWTLTAANDINNNGLIAGTGMYNDGAGGLRDGQRAFILDASSIVPEPEFALIALAALCMARRRRIS